MRLITDVFAFCSREVPRWNTVSVSGYHIREAGSTALQELAFTLRDGIEYVQYGIDAGLDVDDFAPRISFFFNSHSDFFEEIAKFRAARKLWAEVMRDRFGAQERAIVEAALPHADRRRLADRAAAVQQRRAHGAAGAGGGAGRHQLAAHQLARRSAGAADRAKRRRWRCGRSRSSPTRAASTNVVDPLGGSYFVERLTLDMERGAKRLLRDHRSHGWHGRGDRAGLPAARDRRGVVSVQQAVERGKRSSSASTITSSRTSRRCRFSTSTRPRPTCSSAGSSELRADARQRSRCAARSTRCATAARGTRQHDVPMLDCVRAYATVGEMCDALREVWGEYEEVPVI